MTPHPGTGNGDPGFWGVSTLWYRSSVDHTDYPRGGEHEVLIGAYGKPPGLHILSSVKSGRLSSQPRESAVMKEHLSHISLYHSLMLVEHYHRNGNVPFFRVGLYNIMALMELEVYDTIRCWFAFRGTPRIRRKRKLV